MDRDYCSPCHRYLNGALSCPGCGAPAQDHSASSARPGAGAEEPPTGDTSTRASRRKASHGKPRRPAGRARRARRGRGRRVVILASVLGPILAAVFVADLSTEGGLFHERETTDDRQSVAERGYQDPDEPGPGAPSAGPSAAPSHGTMPGDERPADEDEKKGKKKKRDKDRSEATPSPGASASPSGAPRPTATSPAPGGDPTQPSDPGPSSPAPDPSTAQPTSDPTPEPTSSQPTCRWWVLC